MGLSTSGLTLNPVTKGSVEVTVVQNINKQDTKDPARTAAPGDVDIALMKAGDTIGSVVLLANDRVLLPNQTDPVARGLYKVGALAGEAVRTEDANEDAEVTNSMVVHVVEGDELGLWVLTTSDPIIVGTTPLTFVKELSPAVNQVLGGGWRFDSAVADADPGSGDFRLNNAVQANATQIFISDNAKNGLDASVLLLALTIGDKIYIQEASDSSRFLEADVSGEVVDAVGYVKVPITVLDTGVDLRNNRDCLLVFLGFGARAPAVHALGGAEHSADTLANLNTKVSDATLDDAGDARPPQAHLHTHASTTGQTADDHHAKSHAHDGVDGSGTVAHADTTGQGADDHHNQAHALGGADHTASTKAAVDAKISDGEVVPGTMDLITSGSTSVADDTEITLATFLVTSGRVPLALVSLTNDVVTQIYQGATDAGPPGDHAHFSLHKTVTANQYQLRIRQKSGLAQNYEWRVYELGA